MLLTEADVTVELTDVSHGFAWASGMTGIGLGPHMAAVTIALPAGVVPDGPDGFLETLHSTIYVGADFSGTTMAYYEVHEV